MSRGVSLFAVDMYRYFGAQILKSQRNGYILRRYSVIKSKVLHVNKGPSINDVTDLGGGGIKYFVTTVLKP
jgi:hypothetical protein